MSCFVFKKIDISLEYNRYCLLKGPLLVLLRTLGDADRSEEALLSKASTLSLCKVKRYAS